MKLKKFMAGMLAALMLAGGSIVSASAHGKAHSHSFDGEWIVNAKQHWHQCSCGEKTDIGTHYYEPSSIVCKTCRYVKNSYKTTVTDASGNKHVHSYRDGWSTDWDYHWHECSCGDRTDVGAHSYYEDGFCSVCLYKKDSYTVLSETSSGALGFKPEKQTATSVSLKWNKQSGADGYVVEALIDGKWQRLATISGSDNNSFEAERLAPATKYTLRVREYTVRDGKKYVKKSGEEINITTAPSKTANVKASNVTKNSVKVTWKKDSKADGYQLQVYKNGKWVNVKTYDKNTIVAKTVSGLKSGTAYKFRVRSYVNSDNGKVYGAYATVKVTTK